MEGLKVRESSDSLRVLVDGPALIARRQAPLAKVVELGPGCLGLSRELKSLINQRNHPGESFRNAVSEGIGI